MVATLTAFNKNKTKYFSVKSWLFRTVVVGVVLLLVAVILFYISRGPQNTASFNGVRKTTIQKENGRYSFYKDGKPFLVQGGSGNTYIKELAAIGGNTVICWDTSKLKETLTEAAKYNVAVIIGLDVPGGEQIAYYEDEKKVTALFNEYSNIVLRYKDNPSLFAWCLGNELLMPFSLTTPPFYKSYNRLLSFIHNVDPHHPVATSTMNVAKKNIINIQWRIPALDFICINTYNRIKVIEEDLNVIKRFWSGPYLISEWAPNGGWESEVTAWEAPIENTSTKKADQYHELFTKYMPVKDPRFLGSMAFYWGNRQEYTHTWYSIFLGDTPNEIKEVLNDCWKGTITQHQSPRILYSLIDNLGAKDNIILSPGSQHKAFVLMETKNSTDTLQYRWEILKEDWQFWGRTWSNFKKPLSEKGLLADSTLQNTSFTAPLKEGPYRVFVTVYNSNGYCATANTPIYVVE